MQMFLNLAQWFLWSGGSYDQVFTVFVQVVICIQSDSQSRQNIHHQSVQIRDSLGTSQQKFDTLKEILMTIIDLIRMANHATCDPCVDLR